MNQAAHYDAILDDYARHYYDPTAMAYRRRYIYPYLFRDIDLNGKTVLELACGSGLNSIEMLRLFPAATIEGIDISPRSCEAYEHNTGRRAWVGDLTTNRQELPPPADCAFVVGGLHHCVHDLPATMRNVASLVLPGGYLLMVEPNARFFLNALREYWYKKDRWFRAEEEAPLAHDELARLGASYFEPISVDYLGGLAYFIILNSLIVRLPLSLKRTAAAVTFPLDDGYNRLFGPAAYPMFIARWRRRLDG